MRRHRHARGRRLAVVLATALVSMAASCGDEAQGAADFFTGLSAGPSSPVATWGDRRTFGSIDGFALLDSGVAVVSDATKGHLHLFLDGKDARSFGRLGPDSADFSTMGSVAALRSDTFVVLDPNRGRLVGFRRVADSVVRLGRVDLPFPVKGVCSLDGRLFVLGRYDSTLVHETTVRGGVLKSFGALEGSTPFEISMNAAAEIACSQEAGAVAVASRVPGELRVFSADGTLVRTDSIAGFVRSSYGRRETGERAPPGANASWNTVEDLRWFGKDLLVQLARMPKPDRAAFESRWLFASGVWKESVPAWPRVLGHDAHGRVYVAVTDPYPVVKLYKVRR